MCRQCIDFAESCCYLIIVCYKTTSRRYNVKVSKLISFPSLKNYLKNTGGNVETDDLKISALIAKVWQNNFAY